MSELHKEAVRAAEAKPKRLEERVASLEAAIVKMRSALLIATERYALIGFEDSDDEDEREEAATITRAIEAAEACLGEA